jgi:hypothetical protein
MGGERVSEGRDRNRIETLKKFQYHKNYCT